MLKTRLLSPLLIPLLLASSSLGQEIRLRFSVVDDEGSIYRELRSEDIKILLNKQVATPSQLGIEDDALNVLILVDASTSQERSLPFEKKAVEIFIDTALRQGTDRVGVAKFSNETLLVQDLTSDLTTVKAKLNGIRFIPPPGYLGGGVVISRQGPPAQGRGPSLPGATSLFDSVDRAIIALSQPTQSVRRKAILVVSDGFVTSGEKRLQDVVKASTLSRIPIYAIGIGDELYEGVDEKTLRKLSEETGGMAVFPKKASKLIDDVTKLANVIRSSYVAVLPADANRSGEVSIEIINSALKKNLRVFSPHAF